MTTISSIDARFAQTQVGVASGKVTASVQNLVSGQKKDAGVADLSVGTILASRVNTLRVAVGNAGQAKSLLNTAKGGLDTILSLLQQQQSLATKASDASLSDNERGFLNQEFIAITSQIDLIASNTNFNGVKLLDGSISGSAGATTATGLSDENYSLVKASQFSVAGSAASSGDLSSTDAIRGSNTLTFTTVATGAANTITIADPSGIFGAAAGTNVISYTSVTAGTGIETAALFVAAAKTLQETASNTLVRQFDFIDNGDGTVQINARTASADVQTLTFAGSANIDYATGFGIGNNGTVTSIDNATSAFSVNQSTSTLGTTGTLNILQASNVPVTATTNTLTISGTTGVGDTVIIIGGQTVATHSAAAVTETNTTIAADLAAKLNASTNDYARRFTYSASGAVITITNNELGPVTANDSLTFDATGSGTTAISLGGGADIVAGAALAFNTGTITRGTFASVTDATQTFNTTLQGGISDVTATYTTGTAGANNTVQFSAVVGGETYRSQVVNLYSSTAASGTSSDSILANTKLIFTNSAGAVNTSGVITDQAFQLNLGSSLVTSITSQVTANTFASDLETQIADLSFTQNRSLNLDLVDASSGDFRITSTIGTILEGLEGFDSVGDDISEYNNGDITINTDEFSTSGTNGSVGSFTVDRLTDTITTTLNGSTYIAYLNSSNVPTTGGVYAFGFDSTGATNNGSYSSTTKILDLTPSTNLGLTPKIIFYSESTTDGNTITVDLGNVSSYTSQINISTTEGETALADALGAAFNVSSNDSLSFQVGAETSDKIGVSIASAQSESLYTDSDGVSQTLSIENLANAQEAYTVLTNAINNIVSLESTVSAGLTAFNASIQNANSSIQNADASRSALLDTDYTAESTNFAEARVRVDAATAVLAQINTRAQGLLTLLRQ